MREILSAFFHKVFMCIRHPIRSMKRLMALFGDFTNYVPAYASAALSFYIIILIVPAFSIIAFASSLLKIDLHMLQKILSQYLTTSYAKSVISVLKNTSISWSSLIVLILSVYAISRGIGNIYSLSKNMFPTDHIEKETMLGYYRYTIRITIFLLLGAIAMIFVFAIGPIAKAFNVFYGFFVLRMVLLFLIAVTFFTAIYMMIPKAYVKVGEALKGGLIATIGEYILSSILGIYLDHANFSNVYGPLASIVMVLFVLDWSSKVFYFGFYMTHRYYLERYEHRIQEATVDRLDHLGRGIIQMGHKVCYVRNVLPEEKVELNVERETNSKVIAVVSRIIEPSVDRDTPICFQSDLCEGCQLQYMNYLRQLTFKRQETQRSIMKHSHFAYGDDVVENILAAHKLDHYRQYLRASVYDYEGTLYIGEKTKNTVSFLSDCALYDDLINETASQLEFILNQYKEAIDIDCIAFKKFEDDIVILIKNNKSDLPEEVVQKIMDLPQVKGLYKLKNGFGLTRLTYIAGEKLFNYIYQGKTYQLSANAYLSVNKEAEGHYIDFMCDLIDPNDHVLSLHFHNAILELCLPNPVVAIEEDPYMVDDARNNAKRLGIENKMFLCDHVYAKASVVIHKLPFESVIVNLVHDSFSSALSQAFFTSNVKNLYIITLSPHDLIMSLRANDTQRIETTYDLVKVYGVDSEPYRTEALWIFHFVRKKRKGRS